MKKKKAVKKKSVALPPQIGGTVRGQKQASWPSVGRKRIHQDDDGVVAVAAELKAAREQQKISISTLAVKLDVAPATLIKFEDRHHPISIAVVSRLAQELGFTLSLTKAAKRK